MWWKNIEVWCWIRYAVSVCLCKWGIVDWFECNCLTGSAIPPFTKLSFFRGHELRARRPEYENLTNTPSAQPSTPTSTTPTTTTNATTAATTLTLAAPIAAAPKPAARVPQPPPRNVSWETSSWPWLRVVARERSRQLCQLHPPSLHHHKIICFCLELGWECGNW